MSFNSSELDLGPLGAPGFRMSERLDFSGHASGRVDPHVNVDIFTPQNTILRNTGPEADFRDITHNQLPGFNGMQQMKLPEPYRF